jgi:hypothetical protein
MHAKVEKIHEKAKSTGEFNMYFYYFSPKENS